MLAVYKRELSSYFNNMTGYIFIAIVTSFIGIFFMIVNLNRGFPYFAYTLSNILIIFVFAIPILTMRSMSDDVRYNTEILLMTSPVKSSSVILGKYFAMLTVFAVPMAICLFCPIIIVLGGGSGSLRVDFAAVLAYFLLGGMFISIGMFISSHTDSQIIAAVGSMGALLLLYLWDGIIGYIPNTAVASFVGFLALVHLLALYVYRVFALKLPSIVLGAAGVAIFSALAIYDFNMFQGLLPKFLGVFSFTKIMDNFSIYYVFDIRGLVLILSVLALFLFLTAGSIRKKRWG